LYFELKAWISENQSFRRINTGKKGIYLIKESGPCKKYGRFRMIEIYALNL